MRQKVRIAEWTLLACTDAVIMFSVIVGIAYCNGGCVATTRSFDTPAGTVEITETSYAGLWVEYRESVVSTPRYRECVAERRALLPEYQSGRALNWEELSPIQRDCFMQTTRGSAMGDSTSGGYSGDRGYAWSNPTLAITPGLR